MKILSLSVRTAALTVSSGFLSRNGMSLPGVESSADHRRIVEIHHATVTQFRPARLLSYSARSARCMRSFSESPGSVIDEMPMPTVTENVPSSGGNAAFSTSRRNRCASACAPSSGVSGSGIRELLAAQPAEDVRDPERFRAGVGEETERSVAGRMPVPVVDVLEVVEVQHQKGQRRAVSPASLHFARARFEWRRLLRPVSSSLVASSERRRSRFLRSVMSTCVPTIRVAFPFSSRATMRARERIHFQSPSNVRIRNSATYG